MKSRHYYKTFYQRNNLIKTALSELIQGIAVMVRIFIEVFTRRNFGERYFSFGLSIFLALALAAIPYFLFGRRSFYSSPEISDVILDNLSWYAYIVVFLIFCWQRQRELKRLPSVFDFERFSLSTGAYQPYMLKIFENIKIGNQSILLDEHKNINHRRYEILLEPAVPFLLGVVLILLKQPIGIVLLLSSLLYSLSYGTAYTQGDHFMMDKIDEMICNEALVSTFVTGEKESYKGFRPYGEKPKDKERREEMFDRMTDEDTEYADFEEVK